MRTLNHITLPISRKSQDIIPYCPALNFPYNTDEFCSSQTNTQWTNSKRPPVLKYSENLKINYTTIENFFLFYMLFRLALRPCQVHIQWYLGCFQGIKQPGHELG
jgi:hypothetical protein